MEKPTFRYNIITDINDGDASDDTRELLEKYRGETILNMIKALDKERTAFMALTKAERKAFADMTAEEQEALPPKTRILYTKSALRLLRRLIALRLDVLSDDEANHLEYMLNDWFVKPINQLEAEVKELRAILKSHNHKIGGAWTSSAMWTR